MKFPGGLDDIQLAGIVDRPRDWDTPAPAPFHPSVDGSLRPVAVFSHCFTCNKDLKATVRISRALAKSGVAVLRYDMTGLGGSDGEFAKTNFKTNLGDLAAAVRFAASELGPVTALIGHSFGGVASLVAAAASTQDNSPYIQQPGLFSQLRFVATLAAPSDTQHLATLLSRMNPAIQTRGEGDVTIGGVKWTIHRQMLDDFRSHDVTAWLPKVNCPVLLLHSPVDETVSIDHALRLMSLIQTDRSDQATNLTPVSLVALPGADHLLSNQPADLAFVTRLLAAWCHRY
ncbi:MAG: alpha/beta fold hydrolase [Planctomycetales bacterium]|nr:alpha/beta fold hydrolase [Planctomycetales bacterium]